MVYLGELFSGEGVRPTSEKVEAITQAPEPHNITELKSFVGMVNFHHRHLPNLSTVIHPLTEMLRDGQPREWNKLRQKQWEAFYNVKALLVEAPILNHYQPDQPLVLASAHRNMDWVQ